MKNLSATVVFFFAVLTMAGCATQSETDDWPTKVVSPNQLRLAAPLQLKIPRRNLNESMPNGIAVLRLAIDESGTVRRTSVVSSSGNAVLDTAAAKALVSAKFVAYREAGVAMAVTTDMPVNVKGSAHCPGVRPLDC